MSRSLSLQRRPPQPPAVLHTRIGACDGLTIGQDGRQLQLCDPLVDISGDSYRLRDHQARTGNIRKALRATLS